MWFVGLLRKFWHNSIKLQSINLAVPITVSESRNRVVRCKDHIVTGTRTGEVGINQT